MARLSLSLFGGFQVALADQPSVTFESDKVRALLAYLAVEAGRPHRREALASLLWPERPEANARQNLSQALFALRRAIGDPEALPPFLLVTSQTLQFNPASDHWLDVAAFRDLLSACEHHAHVGAADCDTCLDRQNQAVSLYHDAFLAGFSLPDSAEFEEWAASRREQLQQAMMAALSSLADGYEERGEYRRALPYARRQVELDPWREEGQRQVMRLLALLGERGAALAQYEACRRVLREELGIEPSAETTDLAERIRQKEIGPPSKAPPSNLPASLVPLVGRERELAEVAARLRDPGCRLLTLVGPGGAGKTRLAIEVATRAQDRFRHGVHFVPLSPVASPEEIVPTIAQGVGFAFYREGGTSAAAHQEQLFSYLRGKQMLLLLDSCEHLLPGVEVVSRLLEAAPQIKVLATTRARLNLLGEELYLVGGLDLGATETSGVFPSALQLFVEAAQRVRPGYAPDGEEAQLVAAICHAVDALPLAILLAASWMDTLSAREIAARLTGEGGQGLDVLAADWRDVPERQRSMRAVLEQSWRLLPEREQGMMAALSIFRGGIGREAAEAVAGAMPRDLARLADRSLLLRAADGPYGMHDLLRRYASERLVWSPDGGLAARDRFAAHFARTLHAWEPDVLGPRQGQAFAAIAADIANIRAAWDWMVERRRVDWLDQAARSLRFHYFWQGHYGEGERVFCAAAEALRVGGQPEDASRGAYCRVLAKLLSARALFTNVLEWLEQSRQALEEAAALLEEAGQAGEEVRALQSEVLRLGNAGRPHEEAIRRFQRALALARAAGDRTEEGAALYGWGDCLRLRGEMQEAQRLTEAALAVRREAGASHPILEAMWNICRLALTKGRFDDLEQLVQELPQVRVDAGDRAALARRGDVLALALYDLGRLAEAREVAAESWALWEELGARVPARESLSLAGRAEMYLGHYAEARLHLERAYATSQELGQPGRMRYFLVFLSYVAIGEGRCGEAERYLEEWCAIYDRQGLTSAETPRVARTAPYIALLRGRLDEGRRGSCVLLKDYAERGLIRESFCDHAPGVVLLWLLRGEVERAVELWALILRDPFARASRWHEQVIGRRVAEAAAGLPPEAVRAAEERGRAREWRSTVEELLAELAAEERPGAEGGAS